MNIINTYYEVPVKALFALTLRYNKNFTLHDISSLVVKAKDYYTNVDEAKYIFDLKSPDIGVANLITHNTYKGYLSNNNVYLVLDFLPFLPKSYQAQLIQIQFDFSHKQEHQT